MENVCCKDAVEYVSSLMKFFFFFLDIFCDLNIFCDLVISFIVKIELFLK